MKICCGLKSCALTLTLTVLVSVDLSSAAWDTIGIAPYRFDCRRFGVNCQDRGFCELYTGYCVLCSKNTGYDCSISKSAVEYNETLGNCPEFCDPEGTQACTTYRCYCKQPYLGSVCDKGRATHECLTGGSMSVTFSPYPSFSGKIYIMDKPDACDFSFYVWIRTPFTLTFEDETCGATITEKYNAEGLWETRFSYDFLVEYNTFFTTGRDEIITFTCIQTEGTTVILKPPPINTEIEVDGVSLIPHLTSSAHVPSGLRLILTPNWVTEVRPDNPTRLGTMLYLKFVLDSRDYHYFEVANLTVTNCIDDPMDPDFMEPIFFVLDGCVTKFTKSIFKDYDNTVTSDVKKIMWIMFSAFRLGRSSGVCFEAIAYVCINDTAPCTRERCTDVFVLTPTVLMDRQLGVGTPVPDRRRRSLSSSGEDMAGDEEEEDFCGPECEDYDVAVLSLSYYILDERLQSAANSTLANSTRIQQSRPVLPNSTTKADLHPQNNEKHADLHLILHTSVAAAALFFLFCVGIGVVLVLNCGGLHKVKTGLEGYATLDRKPSI